MSAGATQTRHRWWLPLAISVVLTLPYLIAIQSFFYTDDWVHLCGNAPIPPWAVWRYFSPRVIWFYRPFQALQFGWLYHAVGLRPLAYNLTLWFMHLSGCVLVYRLAVRLVSSRTALLTTLLFAPQWLCANSLLWRSNVSTLHGALATLGLCLIFLSYMDSGHPALLVATYCLLVLDFLVKETAVGAPFLLAALWWWHTRQRVRPMAVRAWLHEGTLLLTPFVLLTALYVVFHHRCVRDVYHGYVGPYYCFAPPLRAFQQTLFSFNYAALSFSHDPVLLPRVPWLRTALQSGLRHPSVLPIALAAIACWRRDRILSLGLCWVFLTLMPTSWLDTYRMDRFFYLPMVGVSLITARGLESGWQYTRGKIGPSKAFRLAMPLALAYLTLVNLITVTSLCLGARADSRLLASAFRVIHESAGRVPRRSMVVLRNAPPTYFAGGLGVNEMVRLGLADPNAVGILQDQPLSLRWANRVKQIRSVYSLDFNRIPPVLEPAPTSITRPPHLSTQRAAMDSRWDRDPASTTQTAAPQAPRPSLQTRWQP